LDKVSEEDLSSGLIPCLSSESDRIVAKKITKVAKVTKKVKSSRAKSSLDEDSSSDEL
jgi:hypothetical protein